ncbi:hypothetical protein [Agathobaculum sp. Marseille-P7918]|uniref:hypothetical protein n=1 Tax=Agathobaculum sp. Marseille-P7918 TaxID=2479843 RepID=UPI000F633816|nr:hypothetical protein [Agathobaculum sp. Marseille-P7918]
MAGISAHRPILKSAIGEKWRREGAVGVQKGCALCTNQKCTVMGQLGRKCAKCTELLVPLQVLW